MVLLAIETSCDETAAAVLTGPTQVAGQCIASQIDTHAVYGGVVPEIAARQHSLALQPVVSQAMAEAGVTFDQLDAVAVTRGPGLIGALLCGVGYAKGLAAGLGIPLIGVHHMAGHIAACRLVQPDLAPPYVCLVVSGGHTHLIEVTAQAGPPSPISGNEHYRLLGRTRDDAAGEAFDKAARVMHLPYPGGPAIDNLARGGNPHAMPLPRARIPDAPLDFSFSGLKTALLQASAKQQYAPQDMAASFQHAVVSALADHAFAALKACGHDTLVVAGGVAANSALREALQTGGQQRGCRVILPPRALCTDNAAMIGVAGWRLWQANVLADASMDATPSWPLV